MVCWGECPVRTWRFAPDHSCQSYRNVVLVRTRDASHLVENHVEEHKFAVHRTRHVPQFRPGGGAAACTDNQQPHQTAVDVTLGVHGGTVHPGLGDAGQCRLVSEGEGEVAVVEDGFGVTLRSEHCTDKRQMDTRNEQLNWRRLRLGRPPRG